MRLESLNWAADDSPMRIFVFNHLGRIAIMDPRMVELRDSLRRVEMDGTWGTVFWSLNGLEVAEVKRET